MRQCFWKVMYSKCSDDSVTKTPPPGYNSTPHYDDQRRAPSQGCGSRTPVANIRTPSGGAGGRTPGGASSRTPGSGANNEPVAPRRTPGGGREQNPRTGEEGGREGDPQGAVRGRHTSLRRVVKTVGGVVEELSSFRT